MLSFYTVFANIASLFLRHAKVVIERILEFAIREQLT
jgi:hypothetical protein